MRIVKDLFLPNRFFYAAGVLILGMILSYAFPFLLAVMGTACVLFLVVLVIDLILLFNKHVQVEAERETPSVLSLGDDNTITLSVKNNSGIRLYIDVVDEIPEQFQIRDFLFEWVLDAGAEMKKTYVLRPLTRGEYVFGRIHMYLTSNIGLIRRRVSSSGDTTVPVYPSIVQMKKYELRTFARTATEYGVKKVRRVGHSYEFEHIKPYIRGDDYRSINWKATSRRSQLMVNQYEE